MNCVVCVVETVFLCTIYIYKLHVVFYYAKSKCMYDVQEIHVVIFYVSYLANGQLVQTLKGTNRHKCIQAENMGISWAYFSSLRKTVH